MQPLLVVLSPQAARRPEVRGSIQRPNEGFTAITDNVFMVITDRDPVEVRDAVLQWLRPNDVIFVTYAPPPSAWEGLSDQMTNWIQQYQPV